MTTHPAQRDAYRTVAEAIDYIRRHAGRLHDLMVVCEALTPVEIRLRGAGLIIHYGFAGTPLGRLVIGETARGICHAHFVDDGDDQAAARRLVEAWPRAEFVRDDVGAETIARRIFGNHASDKPLHLLPRF